MQFSSSQQLIFHNVPSFLQYRDDDHPGKDMAELYAMDVKDICDKLVSKGMKPGCFIAESLQSCGGKCKEYKCILK